MHAPLAGRIVDHAPQRNAIPLGSETDTSSNGKMDLILTGVLVGLLITAIAILSVLKTGINEIIRGLEALSEALDRISRKNT